MSPTITYSGARDLIVKIALGKKLYSHPSLSTALNVSYWWCSQVSWVDIKSNWMDVQNTNIENTTNTCGVLHSDFGYIDKEQRWWGEMVLNVF